MLKIIAVIVTMFTAFTAQAQSQPEYWDGGFRAVNKRLEKNLKRPGKRVPYFHVQPAPKYPGVYLWDSAFISLIWKHRNHAIAEDVIRSVLHGQKQDGRVPHVVSILGASPWTQPPVLSWAAADILKYTQTPKFATDIYPKLKKYHLWLLQNRRLQNGLFFWKHPYESGIDNSPRFGNRDESKYIDTRKVASVDITSYIIMDAKALSQIAEFMLARGLGNKAELENDIEFYRGTADTVTKALNEKLWDEETGYYYDLDVTTGKFIRVATIASFFPLTAGAASYEQFLRLRTHLIDPKEFNTVLPFPTVSKADPTFEKDMWRGPVWINTSFLVIRGLKNYNDIGTVQYFSRNLVDSVYKVWSIHGDFFEFYDPDRYDFVEVSRKKGHGPLGLSGSKKPLEVLKHLFLKQLILGTKPVDHFVGWTGLANTLAIEELKFNPEPVK